MERDSLSQLVDAVAMLREQLPGAELLPREVLDIVWLAQRMGPATTIAERRLGDTPRPRNEPSGSPLRPEPQQLQPAGREPARRRRTTQQQQPETRSFEADLHVSSAQEMSGTKIAALPVRVPRTAALDETLPISRALRPLRKRVGSRSRFFFDEAATAEQAAETRVVEPIYRPAAAGWLDLALVADISGSMHFWWQTMDELRILLERHSAFRHLRSWRLADEHGKLSLRTWSTHAQPVKENELLTSGGRQLIVIVSDCVSPAWSDNRMATLLSGWMANGPLSVFQLLPAELWPRTEMRHARFTSFRATSPGVVNAQLVIPEEASKGMGDAIRIPVTTLDRESLTNWACVLAGVGGASGRGMLLPRDVKPEVGQERAEKVAAVRRAPAEERVDRFDQTASDDARDMARLLAAAHFPLTPPIMRVIQRSIMPGSPPSAIAEVLLSGLMERVSRDERDDDPESTRYTFTDDEVRQRLLDAASAPDTLQLLRTSVSEFIGKQFGNMIDFAALLADPTSVSDLTISAEDEPFARIGISALRRLGGEYRERADRIQGQLEGSGAAAAAAVAAVAEARGGMNLTGRRLALEHRLRGIDSGERAEGFVRSLYEWGLPVVIFAAIAAAESVTRETDTEETVLLRLAREALERQTIEAAKQILDRRRDATPAGHAAHAAAIAFVRDKPPRSGTIEAAAACVRAALARNGGDHAALVAAMSDTLRDDIESGTSVVSEALPVRAWILVAGAGGMELPPEIQLTPTLLGTELARNGFRLLSGGWGGVDYMTSLAFAVEVELRGGDVDGRLRHFFQGDRPDFDYGSKRWVTGDWIEQSLTGNGADVRVQAVVTLGGGGSVGALIGRADQHGIPAVPLPWTGGASAIAAQGRQYRFGRRGMFENRAVTSSDEADVLVRRVVRMLTTATERAIEARWREYTNVVFALVRGATQPPLDRRAPRMNNWLAALAGDGAVSSEWPREQLLAYADRAAASFPDWIVDDFIQMTEFERDGFHDVEVIDAIAEIARAHAYDLTLAPLERRFRTLAAPVPSWPIDLLPAAARAFFGGYDELDHWTKATIGMDAAECFFRASIPFETFTMAVRYMEHDPTADAEEYSDALRKLLVGLAPRREFVRRFVDEERDEARVIGYAFMRLRPLGIGPAELASRIEAEARETRPDTRPLRQLLHATSRIVEPFDACAARITARALVSAVQQIAKRQPRTEQQHDLQTLVNSVLRNTKLAAAKAENETINKESIQYALRRRATTAVDRMPTALRDMVFSAAEVEQLFGSGTAEQRLLALRLAPDTAGRTPFESVRHALLKPANRIEAMLALIAADRISERLTHSQLVILLSLVGLPGLFADDARATAYLDRVLERLLRLRDSADKVRLAPIAVLGSDPSGGAFRDFVRDLGERLAIHELGVITANTSFGVWLWEGYRRRISEVQSFVVLRRASDRRPLSEGLPSRTVEGDMADLRAELIARAKGLLLIGGGYGAFREYEVAKRSGIPMVAIVAAGGAAAEVAEATFTRLKDLGISVAPLRDTQMSGPLATAAANALMLAVRTNESRTDASLSDRRYAASLDGENLIAEITRRTDASRRTLGRARLLLDSLRDGTVTWKRTFDALRRYDRYVQSIRPEFPSDMYVAELTTRCTYAYALIELSAVEELRNAIEGIAVYDRLSAAPAEVAQKLMRALERVEFPEGRLRDAAARLRTEIAARMTALL